MTNAPATARSSNSSREQKRGETIGEAKGGEEKSIRIRDSDQQKFSILRDSFYTSRKEEKIICAAYLNFLGN